MPHLSALEACSGWGAI